MTSGGKRLPWILLAALVAAMVFQVVRYYPDVPDSMAAHFSLTGEADGWTSKRQFFLLYVGLSAITILILSLTPLLLHTLSSPERFIHVPHPEHWFAPRNRAATLARIHEFCAWTANLTMIFFLATLQLLIEANLDGRASLDARFLLILVGYFGSIFLMAAWLYRSFRRPSTPAGKT